jgi:AraC family transcriptional regulator
MQLRKICKWGPCQNHGKEKAMPTDTERRILRVIDHIHDNPAGDLSLDALADVAAFSRFHWHRLYRAVTGETAAQTVRRMRLHKAAIALVQGTDPVQRIAKQVGYADVSTLTRAFSDAYGIPPQAFRARGELRPFPPQQPPKGPLMYPVTIRTDAARRLAAVPHQGPYHEINRAFEKLFATIVARGQIKDTGLMVGVYYDDPSATPLPDLRSHAGTIVGEELAIVAPIEQVRLPAGRHAVLTFTGPYAGLPAAYDQLYGLWLPESGEKPADTPAFEVYLNSPMDTPQDKLVTEICMPLAAR